MLLYKDAHPGVHRTKGFKGPGVYTAKACRALGLELTLLLLCGAESVTLRGRLEAWKQCCW